MQVFGVWNSYNYITHLSTPIHTYSPLGQPSSSILIIQPFCTAEPVWVMNLCIKFTNIQEWIGRLTVFGAVNLPLCLRSRLLNHRGMLTLFMAITNGVSWDETIRPLREVSKVAIIFVVAYVALAVFVILNATCPYDLQHLLTIKQERWITSFMWLGMLALPMGMLALANWTTVCGMSFSLVKWSNCPNDQGACFSMRVALGMCHAVCLFGPSSGIVLLMIHVKSTRFANEWQTVDGFVQKGGVYPKMAVWIIWII